MGSLSHAQAPIEKQVESERLKFWKSPSFDPSPFLGDHNRETFLFPLDWAAPADADVHPVPRVRVHVSNKNEVKLLETLDSCQRLQLLPEKEVRMEFRNGMFSIPKDAVKDRMVLDARPPNALEDGRDSLWIHTVWDPSRSSTIFS